MINNFLGITKQKLNLSCNYLNGEVLHVKGVVNGVENRRGWLTPREIEDSFNNLSILFWCKMLGLLHSEFLYITCTDIVQRSSNILELKNERREMSKIQCQYRTHINLNDKIITVN